jgi:hypothetical protein
VTDSPLTRRLAEIEAKSHHFRLSEDVHILIAEVRRLQAALGIYGAHRASCARQDWDLDPRCTCGFSEALQGEAP